MKHIYESFLLRLAANIIDRNTQRAMVTSKKDNDWLFEAGHKIKAISGRVQNKYKG